MQEKPEQSYRDIVSANLPRLKAIARNYSKAEYKEDLLQEILYQLWKAYGSFNGSASIETWVYRIALNTAISHVRSNYRKPNIVSESVVDYVEPLHLGGLESSMNILEDFLQSLGKIDRAIMMLYLDDIPQQQISDITGQSVNVIAVRISRMKNTFKQLHVDD